MEFVIDSLGLNTIVGIVVFCFLILKGFRVVRPIEIMIVERFGKFNSQRLQGLRWIIPFIDRGIKINITEIRLDVQRQEVITNDNLNLSVDAVVYFRVNDVEKSIYNVNDYMTSIPSLAQTTLRSIIGELNFEEVNSKRQTINTKIEKELDTQTSNWGINILRVELQDVRPSDEVQIAMDKVVTAEREKDAEITRSEAKKEAMKRIAETQVIKAEGEKRSKIEIATGNAEAVRIKGKAKAEIIRIINNAVEETFKKNSQKFKSLEVAENSLVNNSKIILTEKGINPSIILNDGISGDKIIPVPVSSKK